MPALECFADTSRVIPHRDIEVEVGDDVVIRITELHEDTLLPWDFTGWTFETKIKSPGGNVPWATGLTSIPDNTGIIDILFPDGQTILLTPGDIGFWYLKGVDTSLLDHTLVQGRAFIVAP